MRTWHTQRKLEPTPEGESVQRNDDRLVRFTPERLDGESDTLRRLGAAHRVVGLTDHGAQVTDVGSGREGLGADTGDNERLDVGIIPDLKRDTLEGRIDGPVKGVVGAGVGESDDVHPVVRLLHPEWVHGRFSTEGQGLREVGGWWRSRRFGILRRDRQRLLRT